MPEPRPWKASIAKRRRNRLTEELTAALCETIANGADPRLAYETIGLPKSTWDDWRNRGEHDKGKDTIYEHFRICTDAAMALNYQEKLNKIEGIGDSEDDWRALAHVLKVSNPDRFGDKKAVAMMPTAPPTGANFAPAAIDALSEEKQRQLAAILEEIAGNQGNKPAGFVGTVKQISE